MGNPVDEFMELMELWRGRSGSVAEKRDAAGTPSDWVEVRAAIDAIGRLEQFLDSEGELEENRVLVDALWRTVIQPDVLWGQGPKNHLGSHLPIALRAQGRLYDKSSPKPAVSMTDLQIEAFTADLNEIRGLVQEFAHTVGDEARVVLRIIDDLLAELQRDDPDFEVVRSKSYEVSGATMPLAKDASGESKGRLLGFIGRTLGRWGASATAGAAGNQISDWADFLSLPPGG